ncbi:MAG: lysine--tRNA ligase [Candidatus Latescibacteria bacterium]|nr:lysine--tRNA ligase [Candidatus Latescibacterota bacterium]
MSDYPDFFQEHRLAKRAKLLEDGVNPYPYSFSATHTISELIENFETLEADKSEVICAGRLLSSRKMGKSWFLDIIDRDCNLQTYIRSGEASEDTVKLVPNIDIGDWLGITGQLFRTRTGEPTILVRNMVILGKSVADVPFGKLHDGTTSYTLSNTEVRRQKRYLDWITDPESVKRFELRSKIISLTRRHMEGEGFLEVDTPTLEMVYGGAEARPFTTTVQALSGQSVYLNISLELPLKRYIVGGFPKVFALGKCFRNEGIDATHNPEFTLLEWYEAFTDYDDQMRRFEKLTCFVVEQCTDSLKIKFQEREVDFTPPWKIIRVPEVVREIFGCEYEDIDRKALESRLDSEMSDEKLSYIGISRDTYRAQLATEKLGALVMEIVERELESSGRLWDPCFICDHPRDISPLTKIKRGNPNFVERFEPHIANFEVGNAYSELTDPVEQYERFTTQRSGDTEKDYEEHPIDMDFVHAIACGMPPTGGVGYGIDRLVMRLAGKESIRDVIPFPMRMGKGGE